MPKVKCAICKYEDWVDKMYYCSHDDIWICSSCAIHTGFLGTGPYACPRCGNTLPD